VARAAVTALTGLAVALAAAGPDAARPSTARALTGPVAGCPPAGGAT
jgi:hypothetical protein